MWTDEELELLPRHGCRWQRSEDDYLRINYQSIGPRACARELRRTPRAVSEHANALGLHYIRARGMTWKARDEELVRAMVHALASEIGKTPTAIVSRIRRMYHAGKL